MVTLQWLLGVAGLDEYHRQLGDWTHIVTRRLALPDLSLFSPVQSREHKRVGDWVRASSALRRAPESVSDRSHLTLSEQGCWDVTLKSACGRIEAANLQPQTLRVMPITV